MRVKLQLVICNYKVDEETVTDVITLNKNNQRIEHLGLTLAESKQLLSTLQRHLLQQQVNTFLDTCSDCPDCGTPLHLKARSRRSFRTLFGSFQFDSPRLEHCDCTRRKTISFRPLSALLTESVAPELLYMEAKWSSLVSYGMSLDALQDFLPLDLTLDVKTVRYDTLKVAKRLEAELGDEQSDFIPTVSLGVTYVMVYTYGCDDGKIAPTRCAVIDGGLGDRGSQRQAYRIELFPFKIRSGTKPLCIGQKGLNFAH